MPESSNCWGPPAKPGVYPREIMAGHTPAEVGFDGIALATNYSDDHMDPAEDHPLPGFLYGSRVAAEVSTAGNHAGNHWIAPKGKPDVAVDWLSAPMAVR